MHADILRKAPWLKTPMGDKKSDLPVEAEQLPSVAVAPLPACQCSQTSGGQLPLDGLICVSSAEWECRY